VVLFNPGGDWYVEQLISPLEKGTKGILISCRDCPG
jgi:hypothetical protein